MESASEDIRSSDCGGCAVEMNVKESTYAFRSTAAYELVIIPFVRVPHRGDSM